MTTNPTDLAPSDALREAARRWCSGGGAPVHHTDLGAYLDLHWDDITKAVNAAIDWYSDTPGWHSDNCAISDCYHCQNLEVAGLWLGHLEELQRRRGVE